jgi:hypothetical protein
VQSQGIGRDGCRQKFAVAIQDPASQPGRKKNRLILAKRKLLEARSIYNLQEYEANDKENHPRSENQK